MDPKVLLITPPFTQLNTPYPATTYLKGYLETKNINSLQLDLGIEVLLDIFSKKGLKQIFQYCNDLKSNLSQNSQRILSLKNEYLNVIEDIVLFLQGKNDSIIHNICSELFLPKASRFDHIEDLDWSFGNMGIRDKARHLATLFIEDLSDLIIENVDPHFGFSRYAERLSSSACSFDPVYQEILAKDSIIINAQNTILKKYIQRENPNIIAISVPFPGNLFAALKCGQFIKNEYPHITICLGGGYVNTELRSIKDNRIFEFIDFLTLDDGEAPLLNIVELVQNKRSIKNLKRTFTLIENEIHFFDNSETKDISLRETHCPSYNGINIDNYISVIEVTNPMHRLWSDGFWNKLTMAHGCYWGRCTFCDTSLDYISRFEPSTARLICDKMEKIIQQTGQTGFHFVDEAAPPALMIALAQEIVRRRIKVTWWTNIRFEQSFSLDVCILLKRSGCIAVSGGLEVASNRILSLINKGVSVEKVAQVCKNFTEAGIMTHAYLMYGFPTQTSQETIDSLEIVRQLFQHQLITSGFWHQFALTTHSPVGQNPNNYNISILNPELNPFANNDLEHDDPSGANHYKFSDGLKKSLYNFMHDIGFDLPLQEWFDFKVPKTTIPKNYIHNILKNEKELEPSPNQKVIWLNNSPTTFYYKKKKKGKSVEMCSLTFYLLNETTTIHVKSNLGKWIQSVLLNCSIYKDTSLTYSQFKLDFEAHHLGDFSVFLKSFTFKQLRNSGLLII